MECTLRQECRYVGDKLIISCRLYDEQLWGYIIYNHLIIWNGLEHCVIGCNNGWLDGEWCLVGD